MWGRTAAGLVSGPALPLRAARVRSPLRSGVAWFLRVAGRAGRDWSEGLWALLAHTLGKLAVGSLQDYRELVLRDPRVHIYQKNTHKTHTVETSLRPV